MILIATVIMNVFFVRCVVLQNVVNVCLFFFIPEYYRSNINFTNLQYTPAYGNRKSPEFLQLAQSLEAAIESAFISVEGDQVVTILQIR